MVAQAFNPSTAEAEAAILCEFKAYVMSSQSARAMERDLVSKEEKKKKKKIVWLLSIHCTSGRYEHLYLCGGGGRKGSLVLQ